MNLLIALLKQLQWVLVEEILTDKKVQINFFFYLFYTYLFYFLKINKFDTAQVCIL